MSLINKMNVGNTNYDIQDRLMPDAIGQAGQVLKVKDDGSGLEFSIIESGWKLYQHIISFDDGSHSITFDFIDNNKTNYTPQTLKVSSDWNTIKLYLHSGEGVSDKKGFGYIESISNGHCSYAGIYIETWSGTALSTVEIVSGYGHSMSTNFVDTVTEL